MKPKIKNYKHDILIENIIGHIVFFILIIQNPTNSQTVSLVHTHIRFWMSIHNGAYILDRKLNGFIFIVFLLPMWAFSHLWGTHPLVTMISETAFEWSYPFQSQQLSFQFWSQSQNLKFRSQHWEPGIICLFIVPTLRLDQKMSWTWDQGFKVSDSRLQPWSH